MLLAALALAGCGAGDGDDAGAPAPEEAEEAALEHVGERDAESTVESTVDGGVATVTIVFEGLMDDSVRAERRVVTLEREGDAWVVVDDEASYRCHEGRGQQEFEPDLCL